MAKLTDNHKAALKRFRDQRKEQGEDPAEYAKQFRRERLAIESALKNGPATVPAIASATGLPGKQVLWHLAGMRKYGLAREVDQDGDYPRYELIAPGKETQGKN
ncbi:MAG: winged helix-turn-helix domain-containing protein [Verrucomicrobiia bacterium]